MRHLILLIACFSVSSIQAQFTKLPTPRSYYSEARVKMLNGANLEVTELKLRDDTATFMYAEQRFTTEFGAVEYFSVSEGKSTIDVGFFAAGLAIGYLVYEGLRIANDNQLTYRDDAAPRAVLFVGLSFGLGCAIGSQISRNKKYRPLP